MEENRTWPGFDFYMRKEWIALLGIHFLSIDYKVITAWLRWLLYGHLKLSKRNWNLWLSKGFRFFHNEVVPQCKCEPRHGNFQSLPLFLWWGKLQNNMEEERSLQSDCRVLPLPYAKKPSCLSIPVGRPWNFQVFSIVPWYCLDR